MTTKALPLADVRAMLAFALVTFAVTFIASRGEHSRLHHRIAWLAMGLEVLTAAMAVARLEAAIVAAIGVAGCFLTVYFTDSREEMSRFDYTLRVLRTGWMSLTGRLRWRWRQRAVEERCRWRSV